MQNQRETRNNPNCNRSKNITEYLYKTSILLESKDHSNGIDKKKDISQSSNPYLWIKIIKHSSYRNVANVAHYPYFDFLEA